MTEEDFIEEVKTFRDMECQEYLKDFEVIFNTSNSDDYQATLKATDDYDNQWDIPLAMFSGVLGIDLGDDNYLDADQEWLFAYLFHEVSKKNKALHTGIDTLLEQLKAQGRYAEAEDVRRLGE